MLENSEDDVQSSTGYLTHNQIISRIQYLHDFLDLVFCCKVSQEKKPNAELAEVLTDIVHEYDLVFEDLVYKPPKVIS